MKGTCRGSWLTIVIGALLYLTHPTYAGPQTENAADPQSKIASAKADQSHRYTFVGTKLPVEAQKEQVMKREAGPEAVSKIVPTGAMPQEGEAVNPAALPETEVPAVNKLTKTDTAELPAEIVNKMTEAGMAERSIPVVNNEQPTADQSKGVEVPVETVNKLTEAGMAEQSMPVVNKKQPTRDQAKAVGVPVEPVNRLTEAGTAEQSIPVVNNQQTTGDQAKLVEVPSEPVNQQTEAGTAEQSMPLVKNEQPTGDQSKGVEVPAEPVNEQASGAQADGADMVIPAETGKAISRLFLDPKIPVANQEPMPIAGEAVAKPTGQASQSDRNASPIENSGMAVGQMVQANTTGQPVAPNADIREVGVQGRMQGETASNITVTQNMRNLRPSFEMNETLPKRKHKRGGCSYRVFFALPCDPKTSEQQLHLILTSGGNQCKFFKLLAKDCHVSEKEEGVVMIPEHSKYSPLLRDVTKRDKKRIELFLGELMMGGEDLPEAITTPEGRTKFIEQMEKQLETFDQGHNWLGQIDASTSGDLTKGNSPAVEAGNVSEAMSNASEVRNIGSGVSQVPNQQSGGSTAFTGTDLAGSKSVGPSFIGKIDELPAILDDAKVEDVLKDERVVKILKELTSNTKITTIDNDKADEKPVLTDKVKPVRGVNLLQGIQGKRSVPDEIQGSSAATPNTVPNSKFPDWKTPGWKAGAKTGLQSGAAMKAANGDPQLPQSLKDLRNLEISQGSSNPQGSAGKNWKSLSNLSPKDQQSFPHGSFSTQPIPEKQPHPKDPQQGSESLRATEANPFFTEESTPQNSPPTTGDDLKNKISKAVVLGYSYGRSVGFEEGVKKGREENCGKPSNTGPTMDNDYDSKDDVLDILKYLMTSKVKHEVEDGDDPQAKAIKRANWYLTNMPNGKQRVLIFQ